MLASLNSLLTFLKREDCKVKQIKQQRQIYCSEEKELTKGEYLRLLEAAKGRPRLYLLLQTICSTRHPGIRTGLFYDRGGETRRSGNLLQRKKSLYPHPLQTKKSPAGFCKEHRHFLGSHLPNSQPQTHEPLQHLERNEEAL